MPENQLISGSNKRILVKETIADPLSNILKTRRRPVLGVALLTFIYVNWSYRWTVLLDYLIKLF